MCANLHAWVFKPKVHICTMGISYGVNDRVSVNSSHTTHTCSWVGDVMTSNNNNVEFYLHHCE